MQGRRKQAGSWRGNIKSDQIRSGRSTWPLLARICQERQRLLARRCVFRSGTMLRVLAASLLLQSVAAQTPPNFGTACSISSCSCAGFCLSSEKGKVIDTPPDADGYAFKFSLCAVIPDDDLPSGCKDVPSQDATVVRYKVRAACLCSHAASPRAPSRWRIPFRPTLSRRIRREPVALCVSRSPALTLRPSAGGRRSTTPMTACSSGRSATCASQRCRPARSRRELQPRPATGGARTAAH
jgi:hypothetical protein